MSISFIGLLAIGLLLALIIAGYFAFSRSDNEKKDE